MESLAVLIGVLECCQNSSLVLTVKPVQLITRGPRDLEPYVVKSPLTTLSKKGGAVSAVSLCRSCHLPLVFPAKRPAVQTFW